MVYVRALLDLLYDVGGEDTRVSLKSGDPVFVHDPNFLSVKSLR